MQLTAPLADPRTYRRLLYLLTALPLGAAGFVVLVAGWTLALTLAITPLVVPVLIGLRWTVGMLARAEGALASTLLDVATGEAATGSGGRGFFGRAGAILADRAFWRQQAFLAARFLAGWPVAILVASLAGSALGLIAAPFYYRSIPGGIDVGVWNVDGLAEAIGVVAVGLLLLPVSVWAVRLLAAAARILAEALLAGTIRREVLPDERRRARRARLLHRHGAAAAAVLAVLVVIWAATPHTAFWPVFPALAFGLVLAVHWWAVAVAEQPELWGHRRLTRPLALQLGFSGALVVFFTGIWAATTRGYFWPIWPLLGFALAAAAHALWVHGRSSDPELEERIERLETTRAGAIDAQENELRRIERDLHDGAQARLVALGMSLGLAEQKLSADPDSARELVTEARVGVGEALQELRDLVRGIHPPLLTDRGLGAAITALADRSAVPVGVKVDVPARPAPALETAAYFVAAEALANAGKHAAATRVVVDVLLRGGVLDVQVADDGVGGADAAGAGLTGLRHRVEALDGTLAVSSPAGGPTIVHARLPCAS